MNCSPTVSLPVATNAESRHLAGREQASACRCSLLYLLDAFVRFEHVLDVSLENQEIGGTPSIDLERAAIVPLNRTFNLFAILQHDNHGRVSVDLFLVVEDLGTGFRRRGYPFAHLHGGRCMLRTGCGTPLSFAALSVLMPVRPLSGMSGLTGLALHFRECGSNKLAIHLVITSETVYGFKLASPGTFCSGDARGVDQRKHSRRLRPSEERSETLPVMENPARDWRYATQPRRKKQSAKQRSATCRSAGITLQLA